MKIHRIIFLVLDFFFRVGGGILALINLLGYIWFASTLPFALLVPPLVMLSLIFIPLKILSNERWLLVVLAAIYIASLVFGGFEYAMTNETFLTPSLLNTLIIMYFITRAMCITRDCK